MKTRTTLWMLVWLLCSLSFQDVMAQEIAINYDENKIPAYELPDLLLMNNGEKVKNARQWTHERRAEILEIFAQEMYGHIPARPEGLHFKKMSEETVYQGLGIR